MKRFKKAGMLILSALLLGALFNSPVKAGVTYANTVFSTLTHITSSNDFEGYPWTEEAPTEDYETILTPDEGYKLPDTIIVKRNIDSEFLPTEKASEKIYIAGTDYQYDKTTGDLKIFVATLGDIAFIDSPYHIEILAEGVLLENNNDLDDIPKTADKSNSQILLIVAGLSALTVIAVAASSKRKQN